MECFIIRNYSAVRQPTESTPGNTQDTKLQVALNNHMIFTEKQKLNYADKTVHQLYISSLANKTGHSKSPTLKS